MPFSINGIGTTISPLPNEGDYAIAVLWFTFLFIPIMPLGFRFIRGRGGSRYEVIKKLSFEEASRELGLKGLGLTIAFGYAKGIALFLAFCFAISLTYFIRRKI